MGGRGRSSGVDSRQITIHDVIRQHEIAEIIFESEKKREGLLEVGISGGTATPRLLKKCACCGEYSVAAGTEYETCPICGWIDDTFQNQHPKSLDGKNPISLMEARIIYQKNR
jgi:hypothetical protein